MTESNPVTDAPGASQLIVGRLVQNPTPGPPGRQWHPRPGSGWAERSGAGKHRNGTPVPGARPDHRAGRTPPPSGRRWSRRRQARAVPATLRDVLPSLRLGALLLGAALVVAGCGLVGAAASFDPSGPCVVDGKAPGAYPELEG